VEIDVMKKTLLAVALAAALVPSFAMAEKGDIVVRLRATQVSPDTNSKLDSTTNVFGPNSSLKVDDNTIPEIDFSYYLTKNIAAELILAVGTRHQVNLHNGSALGLTSTADLGKVDLLPPTLLAQWHFNPDQTFDPYVGAGISYIYSIDKKLNLGAVPIKISQDSWGAALQAGFDYNLPEKWLVNFDVKKIWFDTTVKADLGTGYTKIDKLDIDPWVVSVGFGKKF
jgi:outer membrane protein